MKKQITTVEILIILTGLLLVGPVMLNGCLKHKSNTAVSMSAEQTVCPVTGMAIDKNIWTDYKGKRVYFCTQDCKEEFLKNPDKYIGNLPQFKGQAG